MGFELGHLPSTSKPLTTTLHLSSRRTCKSPSYHFPFPPCQPLFLCSLSLNMFSFEHPHYGQHGAPAQGSQSHSSSPSLALALLYSWGSTSRSSASLMTPGAFSSSHARSSFSSYLTFGGQYKVTNNNYQLQNSCSAPGLELE